MSFKIITENVVNYLKEYFEVQYFNDVNDIPDSTDIIWDPNVGGGYVSDLHQMHSRIPAVITLHGTRLFSLKIKELKNQNLTVFKILKNRVQQKKLWKKNMMRFKKIVTVSHYSKKEINQFLNIKPDHIEVVYNAVDHNDFYFDQNTKKKYLLHISEYQKVKNLDRIIKAYIHARKKKGIPDLWILSRRFDKTIDHPNIKILDERYRNTKELVKLYQEAYAFIFPSLHEGFGIPIIEAMACGTPVITSDKTACPETAGEAALFVNPKKTDDIEKALLKICTDKELHSDLQKKGLKRASFFRWKKTADRYHKIFNTAINE